MQLVHSDYREDATVLHNDATSILPLHTTIIITGTTKNNKNNKQIPALGQTIKISFQTMVQK